MKAETLKEFFEDRVGASVLAGEAEETIMTSGSKRTMC
jgi:hypothetical protein